MALNPVIDLDEKLHPAIIPVEIPDSRTKNKILNDMVMAFIGNREGCETERSTEKYCKSVLETCTTGFKPNGVPWKRMPGKLGDDWYDILRKRLRIYKYDIDQKIMTVKSKKVVEKIKEKYGLKNSKKDIGEETMDSVDDFTISEKIRMKEFKADFLKDFPTNVSVVDDVMVDRLAFMKIMNERDYNQIEVTKDLTKEIITLAESLGVAGKQRIVQHDRDRSGTLDELVNIYEETKKEYIDIDKEYMLEELNLISNAIHRGDLQEFLGMFWIRTLFGNEIEGKPINVKNVDKFLRHNGVTLGYSD